MGVSDDIYTTQAIVTADTGFSDEQNNRYLKDAGINAYIPDNQFRSRDPKFKHQKDKYGKRHQANAKGIKKVIPAGDFTFDLKAKTCECPVAHGLPALPEAGAVHAQPGECEHASGARSPGLYYVQERPHSDRLDEASGGQCHGARDLWA